MNLRLAPEGDTRSIFLKTVHIHMSLKRLSSTKTVSASAYRYRETWETQRELSPEVLEVIPK